MKLKEGDYINGAYINKVNNNKTYYMQSRFIYNELNQIIYCIEPFNKISTTIDYNVFDTNFDSITNIDEYTWKKILTASYFGFNYENHFEPIWYSITQVLIWKYIYPNNDIYFTDKLNGNKTNKYDYMIDELNNMVESYLNEYSSYSIETNIDYNETTSFLIYDFEPIEEQPYYYKEGDYLYVTPNFIGQDIIGLKRKQSYEIYTSGDYQKLIKTNTLPDIFPHIKYQSVGGKIDLSFIYKGNKCKDNLSNIYGLYDDNNNLITEINLDENPHYLSEYLKYGKYYVRQLSHSCSYKEDSTTYEVYLYDSITYNIIDLLEARRTLNINHKKCNKDQCISEPNVTFEISSDYETIYATTDEDGNLSIDILNDNYTIKSLDGDSYYSKINTTLNTYDYIDTINLELNSYLEYADL